ncbi:hypothetical protein YC2023_098677 [Brassica napus]
MPTRVPCSQGYAPPSGYVPPSGSAPSRLRASIYINYERLDPSLKAINPNTFHGSTPRRSGTAPNGRNLQLQIRRHPRTEPNSSEPSIIDQEDPGIFTIGRRPPPHDQSPLLLLRHRRHILAHIHMPRDLLVYQLSKQENTLNDMSPSSYHSVELSTDQETLHLFLRNLSTPATWGKKQLLLTRSMVHPAGNTSPRKDSTRLTSVARSIPAGPGPKPQVRSLQSLVLAGPRPKPQVISLQSLVPAGSGSQPQSRPLQSLVPAGSGS